MLPIRRFDTVGCSLRAIAALSLLAAAPASLASAATLHSAPLLAVPGTSEVLRCGVANVGEKPIASMHIAIRSTNFGTVLAEVDCTSLPPGADCTATYNVGGAPLIAYFACRVDASAPKAAMRAVLTRENGLQATSSLAVELH